MRLDVSGMAVCLCTQQQKQNKNIYIYIFRIVEIYFFNKRTLKFGQKENGTKTIHISKLYCPMYK